MEWLIRLLNNRKREERISSWKLNYEWFKPAQEGLREALCTLANGYFGTRGATAESVASRIHYPGTYIAGVYNTLATHISGKTVYNEDLVNCPNWLYLTFRIDKGDWINPSAHSILSYYQELNMRRGILNKKITIKNNRGNRTTIETQRIVHMRDPHCAAIRYVIIPENYQGPLTIRSALDGRVQNTGVARYRQLNSRHLRPYMLGGFGRNGIYLGVKTTQSDIIIAEAATVRIFSGGKEIRPLSKLIRKGSKGIFQEFGILVESGHEYEIEKIVSIYTSRDKRIGKPISAAINLVKGAPRFKDLLKPHTNTWSMLWNRSDIQIEGDTFSQKALRLHMFHLLQVATIHNTSIDASIPARGLHGEAYRGHIFWDELFVMPFFDFHNPKISKALLLYRYRRLPKAREYARENGYKGSMFPWQSGSEGKEETQVIHLNPMSGKWGSDSSRIQRHVSFAIAYNVWKYWERTMDREFINNYGAEILLSIAQSGASLAVFEANDGRYHTNGIMGPDEFHEKLPQAREAGFKDNAYTNVLIVFTLLNALKVLTIIPEQRRRQLLQNLGIDENELNLWRDITHKMRIIINDEGIISQFDGYFDLKELDWDAYREQYGNIQRLDRILKAEGKSPNEYKVSKQADVLMLFYLFSVSQVKEIFNKLGYNFSMAMLKKNYDYYIKRTSHGSTLSKVVHCYVSHILGRKKEAWEWFLEVIKSDINDTQGGTTPEGIHTGVMGGSIYIVMLAFAGINFIGDYISINPKLPDKWTNMKFKFLFKGILVSLFIAREYISIDVQSGISKKIAVPFEIRGKFYKFYCGRKYKIKI